MPLDLPVFGKTDEPVTKSVSKGAIFDTFNEAYRYQLWRTWRPADSMSMVNFIMT